ncbi:MAG: ABC transporter ATP-binding protein [Polyangiaceae bacterium]
MRGLRRLLQFVAPYRAAAILSLVMLALAVGLDLAIPRLIQRIIDEGIRKNDRALVVQTAGLMLGISVVSTFVAIANNNYSVRVGEGVARDLREAMFVHIQRFSFGNLDKRRTGELLVRLTSDVAAVKTLTQISLRIGTRAPLLMLGSVALMITTSPRLALTLAPLLAITIGLVAFFVVRMEPLFRAVQKRLDVVNGVLQENIAGARLVKAFVRADFEEQRFGAANDAMTARSIKTMQLMGSMTPALSMCVNAGVVIVVWLGGARSISGELTIGQVVAFSNYLLTTMTPLVMMALLSNIWAAGLASLKRIEDVLGTVPEVVDAKDAIALDADARGTVAFADVSFAYRSGSDDAGDRVLADVDLDASPGETVAILGSTGAGKSTLVALIARLYDVSVGRVLVAGHDVRELTRDSLLGMVAFVPQETVLFSGTVRDNIRYGRPSASDDDVERAARAAQAHDFIMKLPGGYDARVEQRGTNLSGGQKQRVAIARALLVDPRVLVLDDSTSAVDVETETRIQAALKEGAATRTTFVVAQRISTVLEADRILVLDKGRIVARGTHEELLASSPLYREIYDSQLGAAPDAPVAEGG